MLIRECYEITDPPHQLSCALLIIEKMVALRAMWIAVNEVTEFFLCGKQFCGMGALVEYVLQRLTQASDER